MKFISRNQAYFEKFMAERCAKVNNNSFEDKSSNVVESAPKAALNMSNYIGQDDIIRRVTPFIRSCKISNEALPHSLFVGPGGLGKTSLAGVLAKEIGVKYTATIADNIKTETDIINLLRKSFADQAVNPIIFIDEIHMLTQRTQELFYTAMEDRIIFPKLGPPMKVKPFTLIGGTTNAEKLAKPFHSRFILSFEFNYYNIKELTTIIHDYILRSLLPKENNIYRKYIDTTLKNITAASLVLAKRARGIARKGISIAYKYLIWLLQNNNSICHQSAEEMCSFFGIDELGLEEIDYRFMHILYKYYPNAIGVKNAADQMSYSQKYIEEYIEPWLINIGLVTRTRGGRALTEDGVRALLSYGGIDNINNFEETN